MKDISIGFEIPNLQKVINNNNETYIKDVDYKTFNVITKVNEINKSKIYLFMTYEGIIKLLYVSRNANAKYFRNWATEKLFTIQMGEPEQKEELAASLIGVNHRTIKDVFSANTDKTPCIYLFLIGNAKELLKNDEYNENDLLCKFGCTDNLSRRNFEHSKAFKKEFNKDIELICFSIIESQFIFSAETNITQYFKSNLVEYKNTKELIVINKKDLHSIKTHYGMIQKTYIGRFSEMHEKIHSMEKDILDFQNKLILKDKEIEMKDKEIELICEKHKNELQKKDIELKDKDIEMLKIQLQYYQK